MASVTEAEGLAELGLWQDAWEVLEDLPAHEGSAPAALRVKLACCLPLNAWETGRHIADLLREGDEADRRNAATFFHALAVRWLAEGDRYAAGEAVKAALSTWPKQRLKMLEDPEVSDLL